MRENGPRQLVEIAFVSELRTFSGILLIKIIILTLIPHATVAWIQMHRMLLVREGAAWMKMMMMLLLSLNYVVL